MLGKYCVSSGIRIGLFLIVMQLCSVAVAQNLQPMESRPTSERPNPPGEPTQVALAIYLFDIDEIDDVGQRFGIDMFIGVAWHDPRLALPADEQVGQTRNLPLDQIWTPHGIIVNDRGLTAQLPRIAEVDDDGNVVYRQRLSGELAVVLELQDFPFDKQLLPIDFVSYLYSPDEVRLVVNSKISADASSFSAAGWKMAILEPEYGELSIPAAGVVRSRMTYYIEAERNSQYYLLTMLLPMSLIVFMSWTVFWLQPDIVPARIGISTASIFSLLALGFSIRMSLPAVSYMTRADLFVTGCTLLIFVALGVAVIGSRWANSDRMGQALRLNAIARWIYIGLFGMVTIFALAM